MRIFQEVSPGLSDGTALARLEGGKSVTRQATPVMPQCEASP